MDFVWQGGNQQLSRVARSASGDRLAWSIGAGHRRLRRPPRRKRRQNASFTGSGYPGVDAANTRNAIQPDRQLQRDQPQQVWTAPITGASNFGSYASTPVIDKGVIYSQDLASNVQAISLDSGEVLWSTTFDQPDRGPQRRRCRRRPGLRRHADRSVRARPENRQAALVGRLTSNANEGIDMAPGYHDGMVYVSTVPVNTNELYEGGGVGILWALDAKTGKKLWHFNTVPKDLWGNPGELRRRGLVPAGLRRQGLHVLRHRQPGAVPRHAKSTRRARAGPGPISTPTPWSSSTPRPASSTGTTRSRRTTSTTGTSRARRS